MPEIRASFDQGMGLQIEKVGQNVTGEGASVGTLCRRGGARCSGTFCRWNILSPNRFERLRLFCRNGLKEETLHMETKSHSAETNVIAHEVPHSCFCS